MQLLERNSGIGYSSPLEMNEVEKISELVKLVHAEIENVRKLKYIYGSL